MLDLFTGESPMTVGQIGNHHSLEVLMKRYCFIVIAEVISEKRKGSLCWSASAISPLEASRTVVPEIKPGRQRTAINGHSHCISFSYALVEFHSTPPTSFCISSAFRSSGWV